MKDLAFVEQEGVCVVNLPSHFTQHDYLNLRSYFKDAFIDRGKLNVVLECTALIDPPSIAYGVMCSINRDLLRSGGRFAIGNIPTETRDIMERIHITNQVNVFLTTEEALASFT